MEKILPPLITHFVKHDAPGDRYNFRSDALEKRSKKPTANLAMTS